MSRFLAVLLVLVIVVVGVGYYLDWFQVKTDKGPGTYQVDLTIDKDKIKSDADAAQDRAKGLGNQAKEAATPNSSGNSTATTGSPSR